MALSAQQSETQARKKLNELSRMDPDRPGLTRFVLVEGFRWFVILAVIAFALFIAATFINAIV